jgi:uncharacterized protein
VPTVSNASPLIAPAAIDRLELLPALFGSVEIPPAVAAEIAPSVSVLREWLHVQPLALPQPVPVESSGLGAGEREALALGLEVHAERVILDDRPARQLAQALGLSVVGTLGVLLAAKRLGLLELIQPSLDALRDRRFFMGQRLYAEILRLAHESNE